MFRSFPTTLTFWLAPSVNFSIWCRSSLKLPGNLLVDFSHSGLGRDRDSQSYPIRPDRSRSGPGIRSKRSTSFGQCSPVLSVNRVHSGPVSLRRGVIEMTWLSGVVLESGLLWRRGGNEKWQNKTLRGWEWGSRYSAVIKRQWVYLVETGKWIEEKSHWWYQFQRLTISFLFSTGKNLW